MEIKCPMCGNNKFETGKLRGYHDLKFKSENSGLISRHTILGGKKIKAKRCLECGFVAAYAD